MIYFLRGFRGITLFPFLVLFFFNYWTYQPHTPKDGSTAVAWSCFAHREGIVLYWFVWYFYVITVNDCTRICYRKKIYIKCFCLFFQCSSSGRFELYSCCALNLDVFHRPKCCWGFTILNSRFELSCKRRTKNSDREMSMGLIICTSQNHPSPYFGGLNHQLQRLLAVNTE